MGKYAQFSKWPFGSEVSRGPGPFADNEPPAPAEPASDTAAIGRLVCVAPRTNDVAPPLVVAPPALVAPPPA